MLAGRRRNVSRAGNMYLAFPRRARDSASARLANLVRKPFSIDAQMKVRDSGVICPMPPVYREDESPDLHES
jgi:hypothetical protein